MLEQGMQQRSSVILSGPPGQHRSIAGPNYCVGAASAFVRLIFCYLDAKTAVSGGALTKADLTKAHDELVAGFESILDFFEGIHQPCMAASGATNAFMFGKGVVLSQLLLLLTRKAAEDVVPILTNRTGSDSMPSFYQCTARCLSKFIRSDAEATLEEAYMKLCIKHGSSLIVAHLLKDEKIRSILVECLQLFETRERNQSVLLSISNELARVFGIADAKRDKMLETIGDFLWRFHQELSVALGLPLTETDRCNVVGL